MFVMSQRQDKVRDGDFVGTKKKEKRRRNDKLVKHATQFIFSSNENRKKL